MCLLGLLWADNLYAQDQNSEYRASWLQAEKEYSTEYIRKLEAENRREYIKLFFDLGKEYFEAEDYPAALVSFKRVVSLETVEKQKEFTLLAGRYIEAINSRLMNQVEQQCSRTCDKDLARLKKGIEEIVAQPPVVVYEPEPEPEAVKESKDKRLAFGKEPVADEKLTAIEQMKKELLAEKEELDKDKELMKLKLKKEILSAKKEIEALLFDKKTREINDKREAKARMISLRELYRKKEFAKALQEAEAIIILDPDLREARRIKDSIESQLARKKAREERERQRLEAKQRRAQEAKRRRLAREEEKRKRAEQARAKALKEKIDGLLKDAEKEILRQRYLKAKDVLEEALALDANNPEVLRLYEYIKVRMQEGADSSGQ